MNAKQIKKDKICAYSGGGGGGGGVKFFLPVLEFLVPQIREYWVL